MKLQTKAKNWVRVTNPGLFAQLLVEASAAPISAVLEALDTNALFTTPQKPSVEAPRINPYADKALDDKDGAASAQYRKPPPQLNIT